MVYAPFFYDKIRFLIKQINNRERLRLKKFLSEYKVELAALFLAAFGVFLLVEQMDLRQKMAEILQSIAAILSLLFNQSENVFFNYLRNLRPSDLLGWILILSVLVFIILRIRYRFANSDRWKVETCPICGSDLHRTHRSTLDHILSKIFLPNARRYRCNNQKCGWNGLRRRLEHELHPHQKQDIETIPTQQE